MKWCLALISVCLLIGCAAPPQLQCTGKNGQILYLGPYDEEHASEYVVQVNDHTREFYRKSACRKV